MIEFWDDGTTLYHYGIKGMKWGVRRSKDELRRDFNSVYTRANRYFLKHSVTTSKGIVVKELSNHAALRATNRDNGKSPVITIEQIVSALTKPVHTSNIKIQSNGQRSQTYVGRKATVCLNPDTGKIATVLPTGKRYLKLYTKGK